MACLAASMFPFWAASISARSAFGFAGLTFCAGTSAISSTGFASGGGGDGCAGTSATGSARGVSGEGTDCCCDLPHPTSTTAAIVVISMCFICFQLPILHPSCRRVCGGGRRFRYDCQVSPYLKESFRLFVAPAVTDSSHSHPHLCLLAVRRFPWLPLSFRQDAKECHHHHPSHSRPRLWR